MIDRADSLLLAAAQRGLPLVRQPIAELAGRLGRTEPDVRAALTRLREQGILRRISGLFDAYALGYEQALVAFTIPADAINRGGEVVAEHPGVSHCYQRSSRYNLWATLAVSPTSSLGLAAAAERLAELAGADAHMTLPTIKRYKLDARFGPNVREADGAPTAPAAVYTPPVRAIPVTDAQRRAIRALLADLPLIDDPFATLAQDVGMSADDLLVHAADFLAAGIMRRYAAVVDHRAAGAAANVLVAWRVDDRAADAAGMRCAAKGQVSHCYLRPHREDWPYTLYTMIHGPSRQDCAMTIDEIMAETRLSEHAALWTGKEYKKRPVGLLSDEEAAWERDNG